MVIQSEIDLLIRSGKLIQAYDEIIKAMEDEPNSRFLKHRAILCLVNSGSHKTARKYFDEFELDKEDLDEDIISLNGKINKILAIENKNDKRKRYAEKSANWYEKAFRIHRGFYSGVNLATMKLLSGDKEISTQIALMIYREMSLPANPTQEDLYYFYASKAEALLLLSDIDGAIKFLDTAIKQDPANFRSHATTIKQLELITQLKDLPSEWLDQFRPPSIAFYSGYIFSKENSHRIASEDDMNAVETEALHIINQQNIGFGYGSLAAGADIIFAEALLAQAAELHLILPIEKDAFIKESVEPFGKKWVERFHVCYNSASSIQVASSNLTKLSDVLLKFSSEIAIGQTVIHSNSLATKPVQLIIWDDQEEENKSSFCYQDYLQGKRIGLKQCPINIKTHSHSNVKNKFLTESNTFKIKREIKALMFADFARFSELDEVQVHSFTENILTKLSGAIKDSNIKPFEVNTWGDGLFMAFDNVQEGAKCALLLQKEFEKINLTEIGLPEGLLLRIGLNYGPVFSGIDHFLDRPSVFGPNVTFAARIEPITMPGLVYVSESVACGLASQANHKFKCDYIGKIKLFRSKLPQPIYSLRTID